MADPYLTEEEEEKQKLEALRRWDSGGGSVPDPGTDSPYSRPLVSLTGDTAMESPTGERQWTPTVAVQDRGAPQRGYDPRFDDPDWGKDDRDDDARRIGVPSSVTDVPSRSDFEDKGTGRERADFDRPTRDERPEEEERRPWYDPRRYYEGDRDKESRDKEDRGRVREAVDNVLTWADEWRVPYSQREDFAYGQETAESIGSTTQRLGEEWNRRRGDNRVGDYEGPGPGEAWRNAPTLSEAVTGEDQGGFMGNLPYEYVPKLGAVAGAAVQSALGALPEEGRLSEGLDLASDVSGQLLSALGAGSWYMQSIVNPFTGVSVGEYASALGEVDLMMARGEITFDEAQAEFAKQVAQRVDARGGDLAQQTKQERQAAYHSMQVAYSGTEAQESSYDTILNQDELVEELEREAAQLVWEGRQLEAAQKSAEAKALKDKTPVDILEENMRIGPQMAGEMLLDPLILIDFVSGIAKLGPVARRTRKATEKILDATDVKALQGAEELVKVADEFVEGAGRNKGVTGWVKDMVGFSPETRATRDANGAYDIVAGLASQANTKEEALRVIEAIVDNPETLIDTLKEMNRGIGRLANEDSIKSASNLIPGARDRLKEMKSLRGKGNLDKAALNAEVYDVLSDVAQAYHGPDRDFGVVGSAADAMRGFMSEQFLNLLPRQLINNGISAIGHSLLDNTVSLKPMDNIIDDVTSKMGHMDFDPRISEAYGAMQPGNAAKKAAGTAQGAGGYYGGSNKLHELARKVPVWGQIMYDEAGTPRWAGKGFFGEQNFYARAWHSQFSKNLRSNWESTARGLGTGLREAGLDERSATAVVNAVYEAGTSGGRDDILDVSRKIISGDTTPFSLKDTGLEDEILGSNQRYKDLRSIFDEVRAGADPKVARAKVNEIFDIETSELADIMADSGGTPPYRKHYTAADDTREAAENYRDAQHVAGASGSPESKAKNKEFFQWFNQNASGYQKAWSDAMRNAGDFGRGGREAVMDTWLDVQKLRERGRIIQGKAYDTWAASEKTKNDWMRYETTVRDGYDRMFGEIHNAVRELPVKIAEAQNGTYTRKYEDATEYLNKVTDIDPEAAVKTLEAGETGDAIQAQRQLVDYYSADAYNTVAKYSYDMNAMDIIASAEDDVEMAALMAVSDARKIDSDIVSGAISATDGQTAKRKIWKDWVSDTERRYEAATTDVKRSAGQSVGPKTKADYANKPGSPPTHNDIRKVAADAGFASSSEEGVGFDNAIVNYAKKHINSNANSLDDLDDAELKWLEDSLRERADMTRKRRPADPGAADEGITYTVDETGMVQGPETGSKEKAKTPYYVDPDTDIAEVYDAQTMRRYAGRGMANGPTVPDVSQHRYKNLRQARQRVLAKIDEVAQGAQAGPTPLSRAQQAKIMQVVQDIMPRYDDIVYASALAGKEAADFTMLDYARRRGGDRLISAFVPYHYWYTRSTKNWLERIAAHPGTLAAYHKTGDFNEINQEQTNTPERYRGQIEVPEQVAGRIPGAAEGDRYFIRNPLDLLFPTRQLYETNGFANPENSNSTAGKALETASFFNFGSFPAMQTAVQIAEGNIDQVDWGSMAYPYHPVNDVYKRITGKELVTALNRPWTEYLEGRSAGEFAVSGEHDPYAVQYAQAMIANEANGRDPMTGVPEHMQEAAQAAYDDAKRSSAADSSLRSVGGTVGFPVARYSAEEQQAQEVGAQYRDAGYSAQTPGGSQAARNAIAEEFPWIYAWWEKNSLLPDNLSDTEQMAAEAQTSQYWDEYIQISDAETAAVRDLLLKDPGTTPSEVREFRAQYREQKDALKEKYPDVIAYDQRRDRRKGAMNPFEEASQMVEDILRYEPPGKPEWPGDNASDEEVTAYYTELGKWEEKQYSHVDRVMQQLAGNDDSGSPTAAENIVSQIVTSRYAPDLVRGFDYRYMSPEQVAWEEQWDIQGEYRSADYERWAAEKQERMDRVTTTMGPGTANKMSEYLELPKGQARWDYLDANPEVSEALDVAFSPERHAQAKEMFGDDIYAISGAYPGPYRDNKEAWKAWKEQVGEDGVDRTFAFFGWKREQREAEKADTEGQAEQGFTPAPNWMDVAQTEGDIRNKGRLPIGYIPTAGGEMGETGTIRQYTGPIESERITRPGEYRDAPMAPDYFGPPLAPKAERTYKDREGGNYPVRERAEYEQDFLEVNPLQGFPAGYGGVQGGVTPETMGLPESTYNPIPGYNALPNVTPDEQVADAEVPIDPEWMAQVQAAAYAGDTEKLKELAASTGGGGGGGGGGGYRGGGGGGGGGGGYASTYRVNPYLQRLQRYYSTDWRPYFDKAEARVQAQKVGPTGRTRGR